MLSEYARDKKLTVTQQELRDALLMQSRQFPGQEDALIQYYQNNPQALEALKGPIIEEKAVDEIFANEVKITEKKMKREALEKFLEKEGA